MRRLTFLVRRVIGARCSINIIESNLLINCRYIVNSIHNNNNNTNSFYRNKINLYTLIRLKNVDIILFISCMYNI